MISSIAISSPSLSSLAGISPVTFQLLTAGTSSSSATSPLDNASSIVQLSALGRVLAAGATLENSLQALQNNLGNNKSSTVLTNAQNFVTAFNAVQQNIDVVQPLLVTLPDSTLVAQFALSVNAAATATVSPGTPNLASLETIGILLQTSPASATTSGRAVLVIDQSVLNAAATADPAGTQALFAQATQPLLLQVASFEAQATSSAVQPSDLTVSDIGVPTDLLQNLSADTLQNNIQLNNLDLAAVGLDSNTLQLNSVVLDESLSSTLGVLGDAVSLTTAPDLTNPVATTVIASTATSSTRTSTTPDTAAATAQPEVMSVVSTASAAAPTPSVITLIQSTDTDAVAAEQAASAATQALRNLVEDPSMRAINNMFDPLYSALIAASHQSDFVSPMPTIRVAAIQAEIPVPVLPVHVVQGISSYNEAANGFTRYGARSNA